jgi:leucyl aminopeptidase
MITHTIISLAESSRRSADVRAFICATQTKESWKSALSDSTTYYRPLDQIIEQRSFTGALGSQLVVTGNDGDNPVYIALVGVGSLTVSPADRLEYLRRAVAMVIRTAESVKARSVVLVIPDVHAYNLDGYTVGKELVATAHIASYHYDHFITDPTARVHKDIELIIAVPDDMVEPARAGAEVGTHIGYAVNQARHWCDLPPCVLTPTALADHAQRIARAHNLDITVFDEPTIIQMGMGGLAAVSQGSEQECRFVVLEYKPERFGHTVTDQTPTVVLTGKGITFDSGGLSIKPAARMDEMKDDMAGSAAVISTMQALTHIKPSVRVIGITPISENLPSGTATKPGDIVQFYNGKTAEIKNTDAEGRLILADALSYAVKHYQPDVIFNIATLTGSCAYALGPFFCGMMSTHDDLVEKLNKAAAASGDRVWRLPFHNDYKKAVRSTVADVCNIGNESYRAGAITAGFFLQNFVGNTPWVHLDIAGTSFNVPDVAYYRPGATGFGVRLFIDLLNNYVTY